MLLTKIWAIKIIFQSKISLILERFRSEHHMGNNILDNKGKNLTQSNQIKISNLKLPTDWNIKMKKTESENQRDKYVKRWQ